MCDWYLAQKRKPRVCFGSSEQKRQFYPGSPLRTRLGADIPWNDFVPGPGAYNNHEKTNFIYELAKKAQTIGRARRVCDPFVSLPAFYLSGADYQPDLTKLPPVKPAVKPFNFGASRFARSFTENIPGVGTYKIKFPRCCHIHAQGSFGGKQWIKPTIFLKCVVVNKDKCLACKKQLDCGADYYHFKNREFMCRKCYLEYRDSKEKLKLNRINTMSGKIRDCSFCHDHQGTTVAMQKMTRVEFDKLRNWEAYFKLFIPDPD